MIIRSKFAGTCGNCGQPIKPGQLIDWSREPGWVVAHAKCHTDPQPKGARGREYNQAARGLIPSSGDRRSSGRR